MRDKRLVLILTALVLCALALVGCAGSEEEAEEVSAGSVEKTGTAGDVFELPEVNPDAYKTGWTVVQAKCVQCHGVDQVNNSRRDAFAWETAVDHMIANGAQVSPEERSAVIEYLATRDAVASYGSSLVQQKCMGCHTTARVNAAALDWAGWEAAVDHMLANGAEIDGAERAIVIEWLATRVQPAQ